MLNLTENGVISNSLIFDASLVVIALIFIAINVKRGFSRTFISVIGYILAIILGGIAGDSGAEPIYNSVLRDQTISDIQEVLDNHNYDISQTIRDDIKTATYGIVVSEDGLKKVISSPQSLYNAINGSDSEMFSSDEIAELVSQSVEDTLSTPFKSVLPGVAVDYMMNSLKDDSTALYETASTIILEDSKTSAEYLEEHYIGSIIVYIVKMAIFFIVFFIVMIVVKLVAKSIENNNSLPNVANTTDRVLGGLLGLVESVIIVLLVTIVLKLIVTSQANTSNILSDDVIQGTTMFKYIYNLNVLN